MIGISCEISGAVLVAGDFVFAESKEMAARDMTFPSSGIPERRSQRGAALAFVGVILVATGFLLQLAGYIVDANEWPLALVAAAVVLATFAVGHRLARGWVMDKLHARAVDAFEEARRTAMKARSDALE